jgi:Ca-activated chloride channel homolog
MCGFAKVLYAVIGFVLCLSFLSPYSCAQAFGRSLPNGSDLENIWGITFAQPTAPDLAILGPHVTQLEMADEFVSVMDLKAPGKASREYAKGRQFLLKKNFAAALQHLSLATTIYPNYVAAYNALGSTYLELENPQQARAEFSRAIELDDRLPISHFNLGYAELALNNYAAAEQSMLKASAIAPLDLPMLTALTFSQYMNRHFSAAIQTCHKIHTRKHAGFALAHLFAAAAWEAQHNFAAAKNELHTLLLEAPESSTLAPVQQLQARIEHESFQPSATILSASAAPNPASSESARVSAVTGQPIIEIPAPAAEAETSTPSPELSRTSLSGSFGTCATAGSSPENTNGMAHKATQPAAAQIYEDPVFKVFADEVTVFFSATDHGRPVTDLTSGDLHIRDNHTPASVITSLRKESELPLRIGIVIDSSDSVAYRYSFEQKAAIDFLHNVATGQDDLAFVMGFSTDVRVQQDYTADRALLDRAIHRLAPSGGTALWDAVEYAADKLATHPECQPVARILFVVSDGEDNSSDLTAQHVISRAEQGQVSIYVVSARDPANQSSSSISAEHALKALADLSGGSILDAASLHNRQNGRHLQEIIRNRYFVSYKPQMFEADGRYRPIDIAAEKDGHKLRIWARKGYFARTTSEAEDFEGAF